MHDAADVVNTFTCAFTCTFAFWMVWIKTMDVLLNPVAPLPPSSGVALLMVVLYGGLGLVSLLVWREHLSGRRAAWGAQILSWWRMFPVLSVVWWAWPWGGAMLAVWVGGLALRELGLHSPDTTAQRRFHQGGGALLLLQAGYALLWPHALPLLAVVLGMAGLGLMCMATQQRQTELMQGRSRSLLLWAVMCHQGMGLWAAAALPADTPSQAAAWFWWLCILTALNDVAQFVTGKCFGRHKMAPRISPNKTWQGVMGGLCVSVVLAVGMGEVLHLAPWPHLLGLGVVLGAAGVLGDLSLSAVKRRLGIKDFSNLIPGHGGILDRVDSLVLTAPTLCLYLHIAPLS